LFNTETIAVSALKVSAGGHLLLVKGELHMTTPSADSELCLLAPREPLPAEAQRQMWRVRSGAVRIDSACADETGRFMRWPCPAM
jgi:hypothetical protein